MKNYLLPVLLSLLCIPVFSHNFFQTDIFKKLIHGSDNDGKVEIGNTKDTTPHRPANNIFINLLGDGSMVSVNYERLCFVHQGFFIASGIGMGYNRPFPFGGGVYIVGPDSTKNYNDYSNPPYLTMPIYITGNWGEGNDFFEAGLGATYIHGRYTNTVLFYPTIGYRTQPLKRYHCNFRFSISVPITGLRIDHISYMPFIPFGFSVGMCF